MATKYGNGNDNTINGTNNDDFIYGKGGRDLLSGLGGDDYINGGVGDDFLFGGTGNDTLVGGKGSDVLDGGLGADEFKGGKGIDTVDYSASTAGVTALIFSNAAAGGDAAGDTYKGVENVIGSSYTDYLQAGAGGIAQGGAGHDVLYGAAIFGSTDDGGRLKGDAGNDDLYMAYGNTEAHIQNGQGYDTLHTFDEGSDMLFIKLSDFGLGNALEDNEINNSNTGTATGTHAQFIYEDDAGYLWFDSNGTNAGGKILVAEFETSSIDASNLGTDDFNYVV